MALNLISYQISIAAAKFDKMAQQTMEYSTDPMKKALDMSIGAKVKNLVIAAFNKSVSSVQVNIEFTPPGTAKFTVYGNGMDADKAELTNALNSQLAAAAGKIMGKYQKTPMDYKYVAYDK